MRSQYRGHAGGGVIGFTSSKQTNVFTADLESTQCFAGLEDSPARAGR